MKNYLIITIGTRDVQLRRDLIDQSDAWSIQKTQDVKTGYEKIIIERNGVQLQVATSPDFPAYYTFSPRLAGKQVADNLPLYLDVLELPLIMPVVDRLETEGKKIDIVLTIYTNQEQEFEAGLVEKRFYTNDTIYFADIIRTILLKHPSLKEAEFDRYEISERVADIDHQYTQFERNNHSLFDDTNEVDQLFLLPQGGIDQINHAVTLQLIQAFKHKVSLYQKPDANEPVVLTFTHQFLNDLNKQKILKHLDDYDFGLITDDLSNNELVFIKADFASKRLNLRYTDIALDISEPEKLQDLYLAMKIRFIKQRKYNEFLWRAHTLNEVLFKMPVEQIIGPVNVYYKSSLGKIDTNEVWENKLNELDSGLISYLKKKGVTINNPNRWAYKSIYIFLCNNGLLTDQNMAIRKRVGDKLELLATSRNAAQHGLGSITGDEINVLLGGQKQDYSAESLFVHLDQIFNITGFGIYDTIRKEIEDLL